jgi:hypothetical protein
MTESIKPVRIHHASLDEDGGKIILRGVIEQADLANLRVDDYQREELVPNKRRSILRALEEGKSLPDLELGMRSEAFRETEPGTVVLEDKVYIIDGSQRRRTVLDYLAEDLTRDVRLGVKVFIPTDKKWEVERFHVLNANRVKVAPGVLLRNMRNDFPIIGVLYGLTKNDKNFVLYERVSWGQSRASHELMTASTFARTIVALHSKIKAQGGMGMDRMVFALTRISEEIGLEALRANIHTFFDLIEDCWGVKRVYYADRATYLKGGFMMALATVLADHDDFWKEDGKRVFIDTETRKKIKQFPINDPTVERLAGSSGQAMDELYSMLYKHINKGRTTRRLTPRESKNGRKPKTADFLSFGQQK